VAATVALWFTLVLNRPVALTVGALIMGVAVNGMHFTGMYALHVSQYFPKSVTGISPLVLLAPIVVFVIAVIFMLLVAMLTRAGVTEHSEDTLRIHTSQVPIVPDGEGGAQARTLRTSAAAFSRRR